MNKINIFISSSMKNAGTFNWHEKRKELKKSINNKFGNLCDVTLIEDYSTPNPSNQEMENYVANSDIVVMLLKGDIRIGTYQEFNYTKKYQKKLFLFLLNSKRNTKEYKKFIEQIENDDTFTYKRIENDNHLCDDVCSSIENDIIQEYHGSYVEHIKYSYNDIGIFNNDSLPKKEYLSYFSDSIKYAVELLGIRNIYLNDNDKNEKKSKLLEFGNKAAKLFLGGEFEINENDISKLLKYTKGMYKNNSFLRYRWLAIKERYYGNCKTALMYEEKALKTARDKKLDRWLIDDILIDCRNLELDVHLKDKEDLKFKYQTELNNNNYIVHLPAADRFLSMSIEKVIDQEFKLDTSSYSTIHFNTNISEAVTEIINYFYIAVLYGSNTHINKSRTVLAKLLYKYSKLYDGNVDDLVYRSLDLFILSSDYRKYVDFLNSEWDKVYRKVSENPLEYWNTVLKSDPVYLTTNKIIIAKYIGPYLNDRDFKLCLNSILLDENAFNNANIQYLSKTLIANSSRLNQNKIVEICINVLNNKQYILARDIAKLLLHVNYEDVSKKRKNELCKAINNNICYLRNDTETYALIAVLMNSDNKLFADLKKHLSKINRINSVAYKVNRINVNWKKCLYDLIEISKKIFETNRTKGVISSSGYNPFLLISDIFCKHSFKSWSTILNEFFNFAFYSVGESYSLEYKQECLESLCDIISFCNKRDYKISNEILCLIKNIDCNSIVDTGELSIATAKSCKFYLRTIKMILNIENTDLLQEWCGIYSELCENERIVLAKCIKNYIKSTKIKDKLSFVLLDLMSNDKSFIIRKEAIDSIVNLLNSGTNERYLNKLYSYSIDSSPNVRGYLIDKCINIEIKNANIRKSISRRLINDRNYIIRKKAYRIQQNKN